MVVSSHVGVVVSAVVDVDADAGMYDGRQRRVSTFLAPAQYLVQSNVR